MDTFDTLLFYLAVESVAISILLYADGVVSDEKRNIIQYGKVSVLRRKETIIMERHICFVMAFLPLFAVSALRDAVGWDYGEYISVYYYTSPPSTSFSFNFNAWIGPAIVFICKILGYIDPRNYYLMFATVAFLTLRLIFKAI